MPFTILDRREKTIFAFGLDYDLAIEIVDAINDDYEDCIRMTCTCRQDTIDCILSK